MAERSSARTLDKCAINQNLNGINICCLPFCSAIRVHCSDEPSFNLQYPTAREALIIFSFYFFLFAEEASYRIVCKGNRYDLMNIISVTIVSFLSIKGVGINDPMHFDVLMPEFGFFPLNFLTEVKGEEYIKYTSCLHFSLFIPFRQPQ